MSKQKGSAPRVASTVRLPPFIQEEIQRIHEESGLQVQAIHEKAISLWLRTEAKKFCPRTCEVASK